MIQGMAAQEALEEQDEKRDAYMKQLIEIFNKMGGITGKDQEGLSGIKADSDKITLDITAPSAPALAGAGITARGGTTGTAPRTGGPGATLAGAANRIPVVIDGFISSAAALIATRMALQLRDFLIAAHVSSERGHRVVLKHLGLKPILDLQMRLGEGTGAALAIFIVEAALKTLMEMATFAQAGVSEAEKME